MPYSRFVFFYYQYLNLPDPTINSFTNLPNPNINTLTYQILLLTPQIPPLTPLRLDQIFLIYTVISNVRIFHTSLGYKLICTAAPPILNKQGNGFSIGINRPRLSSLR